MSTYVGTRFEEGCEVYVMQDDGTQYPLPAYTQIRNHSPDGFEWGYNGSGPAQLALAILADHMGPSSWPKRCPYCDVRMHEWQCPECKYDARMDQFNELMGEVVHYQDFKQEVICKLPRAQWSITGEQVNSWIEKHAKRPCK